MMYEYLAVSKRCPFSNLQHCCGCDCMAWVVSNADETIGYCRRLGIMPTTNNDIKTIEEREISHDE